MYPVLTSSVCLVIKVSICLCTPRLMFIRTNQHVCATHAHRGGVVGQFKVGSAGGQRASPPAPIVICTSCTITLYHCLGNFPSIILIKTSCLLHSLLSFCAPLVYEDPILHCRRDSLCLDHQVTETQTLDLRKEVRPHPVAPRKVAKYCAA